MHDDCDEGAISDGRAHAAAPLVHPLGGGTPHRYSAPMSELKLKRPHLDSTACTS